MTMDFPIEKARLLQASTLERILAPQQPTDLVTVHSIDKGPHHHNGFYSALIPTAQVKQSLEKASWDLTRGSGGPGTVEYGLADGSKVKYLRFGHDDGVEPLVLWRYFDSLRPGYTEISEEFRLFHNLYHDTKQNVYLKFDDAGNELVVVRVEPARVQIRLHELKQFAAVREMHIAIFFDFVEDSTAALEELGLSEGGADAHEPLMIYGLYYGDYNGVSEKNAFSRLYGKKLIAPYTKEQSDFYSFAKEKPKKYVDFIIGVDDVGAEVLYSADHARLADYFGGNRGRPHYLTPVFFRKTVLDKYYQAAGRYSVEDGYLRCSALWGMRIDNDHASYVTAWLGDLGRDLPYEEQMHWRSHNIAPAGKISATAFRRQILGQWVDAKSPEHVFRARYVDLSDACKNIVGWQILLPLEEGDSHFFTSIRMPASDQQKDFDDLVLGLTKVLVDSLNEKELVPLLPPAAAAVTGSISRLEKVLESRGVLDFAPHIRFLRNLQSLRSSGSAHRKGSNYQKIAAEFGIGDATLPAVFEGIVLKAIAFLEFMAAVIQRGDLGGKVS